MREFKPIRIANRGRKLRHYQVHGIPSITTFIETEVGKHEPNGKIMKIKDNGDIGNITEYKITCRGMRNIDPGRRRWASKKQCISSGTKITCEFHYQPIGYDRDFITKTATLVSFPTAVISFFSFFYGNVKPSFIKAPGKITIYCHEPAVFYCLALHFFCE